MVNMKKNRNPFFAVMVIIILIAVLATSAIGVFTNKKYMILSPRTRNTVEAILDALKDTLDELKEANNGKAETA